jgi:hypothetical protein
MKTRDIKKQFDTIHNFGFENLIVGGCSFTYNNSESDSCTWPYYLRDLGGFKTVYDFSMIGGGNTHIKNSIIYGMEKYQFDNTNTLIIVQWAGHDRDDYIVNPDSLNNYPFRYHYEKDAASGITGGQGVANLQNPGPLVEIQKIKNKTSRSIENYITIKSLESYLMLNNFKFIFFEYRDYSLPGRDLNFDPKPFLPLKISEKYQNMMTVMQQNFYRYCLFHNLMEEDDFHPNSNGHLNWTRECLLPSLVDKLSSM